MAGKIEFEASTKNESTGTSEHQIDRSNRVHELVRRLGQLVGKALAELSESKIEHHKCSGIDVRLEPVMNCERSRRDSTASLW
jgi:hypothetical protein